MSFLFVQDTDKANPVPFDKLFGCYADYSPQCGPDMPYICSSGLLKGSCSVDPLIWQESRMCNTFCDTRNKPTYNLFPSFLPVPDRSKRLANCPNQFVGSCSASMPYMCTDGIASSGCSANPQFWQNSPFCKAYCDTRPNNRQK